MRTAQVDVLIYPTWRIVPPLLTEATTAYRGDNSQAIAPATGMPAITVPAGYVGDLPVGLQILGHPFDEARLYGLAFDFEQMTLWRRPPSGFPALVP